MLRELTVLRGAVGGLEAGEGQGGEEEGGVDRVEGDNVVDTVIFYTKKAVNGLKLFHYFLDKFLRFDRKK